MEKWIAGFEGKYYCNKNGEIYRRYATKDRRLTGHNKSGIWVVKLTTKEGKRKDYNFGRLIYETLKGPIPYKHVIKKKNKYVHDNSLANLKIVSTSELGKITGAKANGKPVEQLDDEGKVINSWTSARRAAKDLFLSYQSVSDICNNKVKKKVVNVRWERSYPSERKKRGGGITI